MLWNVKRLEGKMVNSKPELYNYYANSDANDYEYLSFFLVKTDSTP